VTVANDMRAAVQAAARYGEGKGYRNVAVATYSSGFNAAVVRDGRNVSQAELGHIVYMPDSDFFCGCGGRGHLEIFVSGNGAASMAKQYFFMTNEVEHPVIREALDEYNRKARKNQRRVYSIDELKENKEAYAVIVDSISSKHVYSAYRKNPEQSPQKEIRARQLEAITNSFGIINSAFNPLDILVCMGGLTKVGDELFEPAIRDYQSGRSGCQLPSLNIPKVVITELAEIGVQGAVAYFLSRR